jgi:ATP-dependent DNA ligase
MSLLDRSRLEIRLGDFAMTSATALTDQRLLQRVQDYRRQVSGRMTPLDASEIKQRLTAADYHVSKKIDGEFNVLVVDQGEVALLNPGGTVRVGLPLLAEAAARMKQQGVQRALIAGELHYVHPDGKRARVHDVSRAARQPESRDDLAALHFAAFDLLEINGEPPPVEFEATWKRLGQLLGKGKQVDLVEAVTGVRDPAEVERLFKKWVGKGAEGAVVRSDAAGMFKIKPRHTIDAAVIGFTEGTEDRQGLLHDLLLALMRPDGTFQVLGRVGGGFSADERRNFLSDLKDMTAGSDYAEVNDQVAYQMVRPEWVIEISVLDLFTQTTRGAPINRMVLEWDGDATHWKVVRRMPFVGLISPQFIRRREDKTICVHDLRLQQVSDLVEIPLIDRDARQFTLPRSTVLRRDVYTRTAKGQTMVRKLVLWDTNKSKDSEDFPAFVIHFTDFSPNRKTPLEREVRVSNSRDQIAQLWDALIEENVKKGWERVGTAAAVATAVTAAPVPAEPPAEKPVAEKKPRATKKPKVTAEPEPVAAATGNVEEKTPVLKGETPAPEPEKKSRRRKAATQGT